MRKLLIVFLVGGLVFVLPWHAASAADVSDPALPSAWQTGERFGTFSYVPPVAATSATTSLAACPECVDLQADAGAGVAGMSTGAWVVVILLVVVVAVAASDGGGNGSGGGY